jgi:hypothetical protein
MQKKCCSFSRTRKASTATHHGFLKEQEIALLKKENTLPD